MSIFREFNINMIPGKPPLIIHVSQYESDFVYTFNLVSGKNVLAIPDTAIAVIRGTKRDGNGFSKEASLDTENNKVVVIGEVQMTACAGKNVFELAILNGEKTICTANFYLDVERAPLDAGTIQSESVLRELQAIIDSAATATQAAEEASASAESAASAAEQAVEEKFEDGVAETIDEWLTDHPEATTTVQDGSITSAKLASGAININTWSGNSSINNWSGNTLEEKLIDFLNNANSGAKLDLQGAKITITQRFVKDNYTFLNNTIISNGIFEIPSSIGGWLSIGSTGGYRVPIFVNCTFICNDENASGAIFYNSSYNFKAVGCHFYNVQIISSGYIQACELIGCNVMNRISYLIECDYAFGVTMTECSFEAGNAGVFLGNGHATMASLTYGSFNNCLFEGFTQTVFRTHGIVSVGFNSCYVEDVPYLIYDTDEYTNVFYVYINGGRINNRRSANDYTIYSNISIPSLIVNNLYYAREGSQFLSNFANRKRQITSSNYSDAYLFGANGGKNEIIKNNHTFNGTSFSFSTNGISVKSQPQAFLVIVAEYSTTVLYTRVSILTLDYKPSTDGYAVTETPLVQNSQMSATIDWQASADDMAGVVTVSGTASSSCSISVMNLGATMSGMIV